MMTATAQHQVVQLRKVAIVAREQNEVVHNCVQEMNRIGSADELHLSGNYNLVVGFLEQRDQ